MATPELLARVVSAFPALLAETSDVKAARRDVMHTNGNVNEALMLEAHRCLVAFKTLGVVVANVKKRDAATARLVAVAIAVYRGLFQLSSLKVMFMKGVSYKKSDNAVRQPARSHTTARYPHAATQPLTVASSMFAQRRM